MNDTNTDTPARSSVKVLLWLGLAHGLNDMLQSVISASYPVIKDGMSLSFAQIGYIALTYQICASVFQPAFGVLFDRRPRPWYLSAGTVSTMVGLLLLAFATTLGGLIVAVGLVGLGSSIIHPEASRLTHHASHGRHGLGQSIFQVGGNFGGALGPLLAAAIVAPYGQRYIALFAIISLVALLTKAPLMRWQRVMIRRGDSPSRIRRAPAPPAGFTKRKIWFALALLLVLIFSKYIYLACMSNFYTFYLMEKFSLTASQSQLFLFAYLLAAAAGTFLGGPIGDRVGRKWVIWVSILGTAPFALLLPHASLWGTLALSVFIGLVLASAFSAILVYAQELLPSKVGLISGLFFGLAFGIAGIAAAVLGSVADAYGIEYLFRLCAYTPLLGVAALLLPDVKSPKR